jgi:hypothetical protein
MATQQALGGDRFPNSATLSTEQAGDGASTHIVDRGAAVERPALVSITTTVGATPTCTYALEGSADGASWWAVPHADPGTPDTWSVDTFAITTAGTTRRILQPGQPWRFLRITYSANTNVSNTTEITVF